MQSQAIQPSLLTLPEAAAKLRISRSGIYRLINAGAIHSIHVGSRHLVSVRAVDTYIARLEAASNDETGQERGQYQSSRGWTMGSAHHAD